MSDDTYRVSGLLKQAGRLLATTFRTVTVEGEVARLVDPDGTRNPAKAARFVDLTLVDVGADRRMTGGLKVAYRLRPGDDGPSLRTALSPGTKVEATGGLGQFGGTLELAASALRPQGATLTQAEYEATERRCETEWKACPPLPRVVRTMTVFEVAGTSRADLDTFTTALVPTVSRITVAGDDESLLDTVETAVPQLLEQRPDLVLLARGGDVPNLSVWSHPRLCDLIDTLQGEGIVVGIAVGHAQNRPLCYRPAVWDFSHPAAVAPAISAHNDRVLDGLFGFSAEIARFGLRLQQERSRLASTMEDVRARLAAHIARAANEARRDSTASRNRLAGLLEQTAERTDPRAAARSLAHRLDTHAKWLRDTHGQATTALVRRAERTRDRTAETHEQTTAALQQRRAQTCERLDDTTQALRRVLADEVTRTQSSIDTVAARFADLGGRAALLAAPHGGPADLQPGSHIVLDLLDRRVHARIERVEPRTTRMPPKPLEHRDA